MHLPSVHSVGIVSSPASVAKLTRGSPCLHILLPNALGNIFCCRRLLPYHGRKRQEETMLRFIVGEIIGGVLGLVGSALFIIMFLK